MLAKELLRKGFFEFLDIHDCPVEIQANTEQSLHGDLLSWDVNVRWTLGSLKSRQKRRASVAIYRDLGGLSKGVDGVWMVKIKNRCVARTSVLSVRQAA